MEQKKKRRLLKPLIALIAVMVFFISGVFANLALKKTEVQASEHPIKNMLDKNGCSFKINDEEVDDSKLYKQGDPFVYTLYWNVPMSKDGSSITYNVGDTFSLDLPDFLIASLESTDIVLKDKNNTDQVRGRAILQNGKMTVTYLDDTYRLSDLFSKIELEGKITSRWYDNLGEDGGAVDLGYKTVNMKIQRDTTKDAITIEKSEGKRDISKKTQQYSLKITSAGPNTNIVVDDIMGDYLTYKTGSIKLYKDSNLTQEYQGTYSSNENADSHRFQLTIGSMKDREEIYVAYEANLGNELLALEDNGNSKKYWGQDLLVNNTASVKSDEHTDSSTSSRAIRADVSLLSKSGTYNASDKNIKWTIRVNNGSDKVNLNGTTLKDEMLNDWVKIPDDASVTIKDVTNNTVVNTITGQTLKNGYTFGDTDHAYVFEYTSTVDAAKIPVGYTTTVKNKATITYEGKDYSTEASANVGDTSSEKMIQKSAGDMVYDSTNQVTTIDWTSTILVPAGGLKDVVLKDSTTVENWRFNHKVDISSISATLDGKPYTFENTPQENGSGFRISISNLPNEQDKNIKFILHYKTYICNGSMNKITEPLSNVIDSTQTFRNRIEMTAKDENNLDINSTQAEASKQYFVLMKKEYKANGSWDSVISKNLENSVWDIYVETSKIQELITSGEINPHNYVVIKDTLPNEIAYSDADFKAYVSDDTYKNLNIEPTINGKEISWKIPVEKLNTVVGKLHIRLGTKLDGSYDTWNDENEVQNTAELFVDDNTEPIGKSVAKGHQKKPKDIISKTLKYDKSTAPNMEFDVIVNPTRDYLLGSAPNNMLNIEDRLGDSLIFNEDSLKVYINDGAEKTMTELAGSDNRYSYNYNPVTNTISLTVPDGVKVNLKYTAKVKENAGEHVADGSNTVQITGINAADGTKSVNYSADALNSAGAAGTDEMQLTVYKYENGDETKPLVGSRFQLYDTNYEETTKRVTKKNLLIDEKTSAKTGYINFKTIDESKKLTYDVIFELKEVAAPSGYMLDDTPIYVVFPKDETFPDEIIGEDGKSYPLKKAENSSKSYEVKFPNTSIKVPAIDEQKGSLTIHKYDYSGSEGVAGTGESTDKVPEDAVGLNGVTFKLYKVADIVQEDKGTRYKINDTVKGVLEKTDNYIDLNTDVTKFINEATGDAKSELNISSSDIHQVTTATDLGNDGIAKLTNLDIGVYLVIETDAPAKVTKKNRAIFGISAYDKSSR